MPMIQVQELEEDGLPLIVLDGDLDARSVGDLRDALRRWQNAEQPRLLMDLSGLRYMDTSGLAHLIETHLRFDRHGGRLVLFGVQSMIADVFEVTRVNSLFHISETRAEAVAALREDGGS